MSLYASMNTAISGLTAQARALGNVADNVANSQTTGFKRTDTNFVSYVTRSNQQVNQPGSVIARPNYTLTVQGTVQPSDNPLAMAIAGQGMFAVAMPAGRENNQPTFDARTFYTRAGDFKMDQDGYMVNSQGYYLQGWATNTAGTPDRTVVKPIRVDKSVYNPVATANVNVSATLPVTSPTGVVSMPVQVYDSLGSQHSVNMTWTKGTLNNWQLSVAVPDDTSGVTSRTIDAQFGIAATPAAPDGQLGSFTAGSGLTETPAALGDPAAVSFVVDFGQGPQTVSLNFGNYGTNSTVTQFDGKTNENSFSQDGVPLGAFSNVSLSENGDVSVNYDNGQSRTIGRVPVVSFADPDKLQKTDGQAYLRTDQSGNARVNDANSNGAGKIVTSSLESSNVDLASEFSKLILAQRAYTANTKIVTAADELLQDTLNMRR
ncbi:flagellar hook protein FlgE [Roseomonas nepalensis]|uniref:Flagellar hook protein FlgE n=1 Tax=Muricoccus nepalensis TaxID=1854500 RepID=A0A502FQV6_9PROT|nr:flagellar hook protein FlgE [Roseomonas nepalensis]TPG51937.1 flagellar hook protein FlgE [Roseomonas nepalensis]